MSENRFVPELQFASPVLDEREAEARSRLTADAQETPQQGLQPETRTKTNSDGSIVQFNNKNQIEKLTRANGTVLELSYDAGGVCNRVVETRASGRMTWSKDADSNRWRSMQVIGAQRIGMQVTEDGQTSYKNTLGGEVKIHGDGSFHRQNINNSSSDVDTKGKVTTTTTADGTIYKSTYDGDRLVAITETPKTGQPIQWQWNEKADGFKAGERIRRNFQTNEWSDLTYVESDNHNHVTDIHYASGAWRHFGWHGHHVVEVAEISASGDREVWKKVKGKDNWSNGTTTEARKDIQVTRDGEYSFVKADGNRHIARFEGNEDQRLAKDIELGKGVEEARTNLLRLAESNITDRAELARFKADIETFEARAKAQRLKEDQVATTYRELQKLFNPNAEASETAPYLPQAERTELAKQVLHHVAYPRSIDQGFHQTCNVSTVQVVLAATKPEYMANVVRQVAETGKYKTSQNVVVAPDAGSLKPDFEARMANVYSTTTGERTYASQIFQITAVNSYYAANDPKNVYKQIEPTAPNDTGERLIDTTTGNEFSREPELTNDKLAEISKQITGEDLPILEHTDVVDSRTIRFSSEKEMREKFEQQQKAGRMPFILMVHTRHDPFWHDNGEGRAGGFGGWHVVTIWDMDAKGRLLMDNQWGRGSDHEGLRRVPLSLMYSATRRP